MRVRIRTTAWIAIATAWTAFEWGASAISADDSSLTVRAAIHSAGGSRESRASVQLVQWGGPYRYRYGGYYPPVYGGPYYAPYLTPYGGPYPTPYGTPYPTPYGTPYPTPSGTPYFPYRPYGSFVYTYPPGSGYTFPVWRHPAYVGFGIRSEGVSFGAY